MNTSEVLNRAADLIEERGWRAGGGWPSVDADGAPLCLEGGLLAALGVQFPGVKQMENERPEWQSLWACPGYHAVATYLDIDSSPDPDSDVPNAPLQALWHWNDARDRTAAEVIEVLRAAALIEAAKENAETRAEVSA